VEENVLRLICIMFPRDTDWTKEVHSFLVRIRSLVTSK